MENVKLAVIYYSSTGSNHKMAKWAGQAAEAAGAEVRVLKVKETAPQEAIDSNPLWKKHHAESDTAEAEMSDLEWADAIIFSTPTRYGHVPAQVQQFLDQTGGLWAKGKLVDKVVSAMSSAQNPHGGQEATILAMYTTLFHWGAIIAAPGYSDMAVFGAGGNPYGTSATISEEGVMADESAIEKAVKYQAERTVKTTAAFKRGKS